MISFSILQSTTLLAAFTSLAHAAKPLHGRHPMITSFPELGKRQVQCLEPQLNTVCPDNIGCCPSDVACTQVNSAAGCATSCSSPAVLCIGSLAALCCNAGSTCDPSGNGICISTSPPTPIASGTQSVANLITALPPLFSSLLDGPGVSDPSSLPLIPSFSDAEDGGDTTTAGGGEEGGTGTAAATSTGPTGAAGPVALVGRAGWENGIVQLIAGALGVVAFMI